MAQRKTSADTKTEQTRQAKIRAQRIKNLIPFKKGDPLINRNGRPRNFDQVRKLFKDIAGEPLGDTGLTRVEAMGLAMSSARDARNRELFLQYAYGKVPTPIQISQMTDDELRNFIAQQLGKSSQCVDGGETAETAIDAAADASIAAAAGSG